MALPGMDSPAGRELEAAAREVSPWIVVLARVGYLAKAVLYATIGILAAQAALGSGGRTTDLGGALREVVRAPMGEVMLLVIAAGLVAYAVWRLVDAIVDGEGRGRDLKGVARRIGSALRGLAHVGLALAAFRVATHSSAGDGQDSDHYVAEAMDLGGGAWLVWLAAGAVLTYGGYQLYRAYAAKLGRQLNLAALSAGTARWVSAISRAGIAARGIVFGLIAVLLVRSASRSDPEQAGGIRESLELLAGMGRWPLVAIAVGLVAYAVYELLNARYRRIRVT